VRGNHTPGAPGGSEPDAGFGRDASIRVKICGVTTPEDALLAAAAGADLLGLNFYPPSPRCLDAAGARKIAQAVRASHPDVLLVGVFVNLPPREIDALDAAVSFDLLQFSGEESDLVVGLYASRALKVFRTGGPPAREALDAFADLWGILVDAAHHTLYGGTGLCWDFSSVAPLAATRRLLVAGGIGPGNAAAAARSSGAWGLDVCSGVESAPGRKDPRLLSRLFEEIRNG
jgi:phosphoribosylanthranilate isomerase